MELGKYSGFIMLKIAPIIWVILENHTQYIRCVSKSIFLMYLDEQIASDANSASMSNREKIVNGLSGHNSESDTETNELQNQFVLQRVFEENCKT